MKNKDGEKSMIFDEGWQYPDVEKDSLNIDESILRFTDDLKNLSHTSQIVILGRIAQNLSLDITAATIRDSLNK